MLRTKEELLLLGALAWGKRGHPECQQSPPPHHSFWPRSSRQLFLPLFPNILLYTNPSWQRARNIGTFENWCFCKGLHYASALGSSSAAATMEVGSAGAHLDRPGWEARRQEYKTKKVRLDDVGFVGFMNSWRHDHWFSDNFATCFKGNLDFKIMLQWVRGNIEYDRISWRSDRQIMLSNILGKSCEMLK